MEQHSQWYIAAPNAVVVCIDHRNDWEFTGDLFHAYQTDPTPFSDLGQMTLLMEKLFDELQFPHPGTNERSFFPQNKPFSSHQERTKVMSDEQLLQKHGDIGTFIIRVQHRQNSSWQGRITWMEADKTIQFRSIWEMIKLIENAVDIVSISEEGDEPSWSD
ncbi:MAG: hypothetical protein IJK14_08185 [Clostridia bacterium]|nr:hypothetical protein [Clostridia bacterium]